MLGPILLKNDNIALEPVSMRHLEDFHEYSMMSEIYEFLEFKPFTSIDETRHYLQKLMDRSSSGTAQYWFMNLLSKDKVVGSIGVHSYEPNRQSIEIGYGVSPDYWGKGIFGSAARLLIDYLVNELDIHRIVARTASKNVASIRGLEKLNFKCEGIMRDYYKFADGSWQDAALFSRLSTDSL